MRQFEFVGGASAKFWEIDRAGAVVTVRFGRLGTAGQEQVKDVGTDAAAAAHVEKLIGEKTRKGYVEVGAAPADDNSGADEAPTADVTPTADNTPPPPAPTAAPARPDEDRLVLPPAWRTTIHPRHDGAHRTAAPKIKPDIAERVGQMVARRWEHASGPLAHPSSDRRIADAISAGGSALSAGGVAFLVARTGHWQMPTEDFVDAWVADAGLVFATRATVESGSLEMDESNWRNRVLRPVADTDKRTSWGLPVGAVLARMRRHLAAASDEDYAAAVAALADYRDRCAQVRILTSFLAPTERAWVEADLADLVSGVIAPTALALALVSSADDLDAVLAVVDAWEITHQWELVLTPVEQVGAAYAPTVAAWLDTVDDAERTKRLAGLLAVLPSDESFALLIERLDRRHIQPALEQAARRFPVRATRLLAAAADGNSTIARLATDILRVHARTHPDALEAARPQLAAATAAGLDALLVPDGPEADPQSLPAVLVDPPWRRRSKSTSPMVVAALTPPAGVELRWREGERDEWRRRVSHTSQPWESMAKIMAEYRAGNVWRIDQILLFGPEPEVRQLLADPGLRIWGDHELPAVIGRYELAALQLALRFARQAPAQSGHLLLPFVSAEIAQLMAEWAARLKSARPTALAWLRRHSAYAARALVPTAIGPAGAPRQHAEAALRRIAAENADVVPAAAAEYGPEAAAAVAAALAVDPLELLPTRIPTIPSWLDPSALTAPRTADGEHALAPASVGHLLTMLMMSPLDQPYAGIEVARAALDPASTAAFGWELFERWAANGAPGKDGWVLAALGWLGDDDTVRRLAPRIRAWPGEGGSKRAMTGLDVLATIGTDVALMHLNGIAQKVKFRALRERAGEKITEIAAELGLTAEELADRLVPDLGLAADGTLELDYGPRTFVVGFDEALKPFVTENGVPRRSLPKPGAKDDTALAQPAYQRFTALKKDVRTIATDQIRRLETAMSLQRRWSAARFRDLFVEHPLLVHLTRRLVWQVVDAPVCFRVAEDRTYADVSDDLFELPDTAEVVIAHPLPMGAQVAGWREVFADYEILQPFEQLARESFALTPDELAGQTIDRFDGVTVKTVKVLSLEHRGWLREAPQDGGVQLSLERALPGGGTAFLGIEPGIIVGMPTLDGFEEQRLHPVSVVVGDRAGLADLDPVAASELLRDLTWLAT